MWPLNLDKTSYLIILPFQLHKFVDTETRRDLFLFLRIYYMIL